MCVGIGGLEAMCVLLAMCVVVGCRGKNRCIARGRKAMCVLP